MSWLIRISNALQNNFAKEANTMNPDPMEQSEMGPYCLLYRPLKYIADKRADENCCESSTDPEGRWGSGPPPLWKITYGYRLNAL